MIERADSHLVLRQEEGPPISGHYPSVDHLFRSALPLAAECLAVLLSGMGRDGAEGMAALHQQAAYTLAQSVEDCVIYGMPRAAVALDAVDYVGTAEEIRETLIEIIQRRAI
jgi:two-component system chemotaxis response regulator CheB